MIYDDADHCGHVYRFWAQMYAVQVRTTLCGCMTCIGFYSMKMDYYYRRMLGKWELGTREQRRTMLRTSHSGTPR